MTASTSPAITLSQEKISPDDLQEHANLARTWYDSEETTDIDHLRWKFCEPPVGQAVASVLRAGSALVARSVFLPKAFRLNPQSVYPSGTICDLLIDPQYRRADLLFRILRAGSKNEAAFTIHGSNEFSDSIYSKIFKYPKVFDLSARGFPLRIPNALRKIIGWGPGSLDILSMPWRGLTRASAAGLRAFTRLRLNEAKLLPEEFKAIFRGFRKFAGPHFERSAEFAEWRYYNGPIFRAETLRVEVRGKLIGYVAMRRVKMEGLDVDVVIDLALSRMPSLAEGAAIAWSLAARSARNGADAVATLANFGNPIMRRALTLPFLPVPEKFLPHGNPIYIVGHRTHLFSLDKLSETFITPADLDFF